MTWGKISDDFHSHPKTWEVGLEGNGLLMRSISYACDHLTDGFLPAAWVKAQLPRGDRRGTLAKMVGAGVFELVTGGYVIHDFDHYNPRREEVKGARSDVSEKRSKAGKKGAEARWGKANANGKPMANGKQTDDPDPEPVPNVASDPPSLLDEREAAAAETVGAEWGGKPPTFDAVVRIGEAVRPSLHVLDHSVLSAMHAHPHADHVSCAHEAAAWAARPGRPWEYFDRYLLVVFRRQAQRSQAPSGARQTVDRDMEWLESQRQEALARESAGAAYTVPYTVDAEGGEA